jgi:nucleotide-binding universal stress UspA family protein
MEGSKVMDVERILVPIDGSLLSLRAVELAGELAKRFNAELTLLTAVDPPDAARAYVSETALKEVRRGLWLAADEVLEQARERAGDLSTGVEKKIEWGPPAPVIVAEAINGYDLVVMGSRGLGVEPSEQDFLGSVAQRVLRRVRCPVLIVPEEAP